jgi:Dyp-type peroxidase family
MTIAEGLIDVADIQGNILAGFNKDHQEFLFLKMSEKPGDLPAVRSWISQIAPMVSSVAEVASFNALFKSLRMRQGGADPHGLAATWLNVAFSAAALRLLTAAAEVDKFVDEFFKDGLAARSEELGDPIDAAAAGHQQNWLVGGNHNEADIVVIIASDDPTLLSERLAIVKSRLPAPLTVLWEEHCQTLPKPLTGHEHFGFKDGVSQPGIRGMQQKAPPKFLTPRVIDAALSPQTDGTLPEFASPGEPLVWPGQFVFGYPRQSPSDPRNPPAPPNSVADGCPSWGRNGSYLVIRRLRQDVPAFRAFMRKTAAELANNPGFEGLTAARLAAMFVGRWPSGAPILRSSASDDPRLGHDERANNFFQYANDSPQPFPLVSELAYPGDSFAPSKRDDKGIKCPFSAHIRKVNPRDTITEQGNTDDVLTRQILRRGIPFGPACPGGLQSDEIAAGEDAAVERGLMFVAYQTSIVDQFVFLQTSWANHPSNPNGGGGQDPIIGQPDRLTGESRNISVRGAGQAPLRVELPTEWVIPTGGGFFFSPSLTTLTSVLGKES